MTIELRLGGVVSLGDGAGTVHHLPSARAQIALARLTIDRHEGTTRHQLADALWPDVLPSTWESALRSVVSRVRAFMSAALPPDWNPVEVQSGRYVLTLPDDVIVDLEDGEVALARARRALAIADHGDARVLAGRAVSCLRSPLLASHDGDWVNRARERFADLYLDALETASLAAAALSEHGEALTFANEAARQAPLRESAHRCRISAHSAAGNRAAAVRVYHELRRMLADEFGVDPSPETEAAYLELLGDGSTSRQASRHSAKGKSPATFVGRANELATLADSWERAVSGDSHVVLITGETGVGKTRLATEAARHVTAGGGRVLCARCDGSMTTAYAPFVELIGGYLAATPEDLLPRVSDASRETLADVCASTDLPSIDDSPVRAVRSACTELIGAAAKEQPLFVALDDVHLADDHTIWLLRHVLHGCVHRPLLIVVTARNDGPRPAAFFEVTDDLERDGRLVRISLGGLGAGDVRELLRHELPDTMVYRRPPVQRLLADTAGNAFLLLELLRRRGDDIAPNGYAHDAPPVAIKEYTRARLSALAAAERELLAAAAVAGESFELDIVANVAGFGTANAHDALDALRDRGLIAEATPPATQRTAAVHHRFVHDVVRRVVYGQLGEARRRSLHQRCADAVESLRADEVDQHALTLAHHRFATGPEPGTRALQWVCRAASRVQQSGAPREALRLYEDALRLVAADDHEWRAEVLAKLGNAQLDADHPDAGRTLLAATVEARRSRRRDIAVGAALDLALVAETDGRFHDEATALLDDVLAAGASERRRESARTDDTHRLDELTLARVAVHRVRLGGNVAPGIAAVAVCALARELATLDGVDSVGRRMTLAREMHDLASAAGDDLARFVAAHHLAMVAEITTDRPNTTEAALAMLSATRAADRPVVDALLAERAITVAVTEGRFSDAAEAARRPHAVADHDVLPLGGPPPGAVMTRQLLVSRCLRQSSSSALDAPTADRPANDVERSLFDLYADGRGRASLAVRALVTGAEPMPTGDEWLHGVGLLGFAAVELADPVIAESLREMLTPVAHLTCCLGYRSFAGPVAFHLGRLAVVLGDWGEAERHLTVALRLLGNRRAHPWIALAEQAMASTLQARGRPFDTQRVGTLHAVAAVS